MSPLKSYIIRNGTIVTPSGIVDGDIHIDNGRIVSVGASVPGRSGASELDAKGQYVLPGFRDQHMHHMYGQLEADDAAEEGIARRAGEVAKAKAKEGCSKFWLALFGGTVAQMEKYLRGIRRYMDSPENGTEGAKLLGAFVEGTFINTDCRGAQALEFIFRPDAFVSPDVERLADGQSPLAFCTGVIDRLADTGAFAMANIVPDYGEPSFALIEHASRKGVRVGMGHTSCHADDIRRAMERGLSFFVHFTNGPTGHNTKPFEGGGAYEGGVTLPIVKEFILDGFHVDYRIVLDVMKGAMDVHGQSLENFILVTDQLLPITEEIPKEAFTIGTTHARANPEKGFIEVVGYEKDGKILAPPPNTLCGSLSTMNGNFSNYISLRTRDTKGVHSMHPAVTFERAVTEGAVLCASSQAAFAGESDTGKIEPGKKADIVIGDIAGSDGDFTFTPRHVIVEGNLVLSR